MQVHKLSHLFYAILLCVYYFENVVDWLASPFFKLIIVIIIYPIVYTT